MKLTRRIPSLAESTAPLVIVGDSGTGKSLLATLIHRQSPRGSAELQTLNFSLLPEREQRIALLGGSNPDIPTTRRSLLEIPSTLVIKHVDRAIPYFQDQLAAAIASKKLLRPGAQSLQVVLCRPIFTLLSPPALLFRNGKITKSLYACLRPFERIDIPPLRDREEDIAVIASHFLRSELRRPAGNHATTQIVLGLTGRGNLHPGLRDILSRNPWPENVRGLKAYLGTLLVRDYHQSFRELDTIELTKAKQCIEERREFSLQQSMESIERYLVDLALRNCAGNKTKAAALLGLSERSVRRNTSLTR